MLFGIQVRTCLLDFTLSITDTVDVLGRLYLYCWIAFVLYEKFEKMSQKILLSKIQNYSYFYPQNDESKVIKSSCSQ